MPISLMMRNALLLAGLALAGCSAPVMPTATVTAKPSATATSQPTATQTPAPTRTAAPSPTRTPLPAAALGEAQTVEGGGFAFRPPLGYDVEAQIGHVGIFDASGQIIISFTGDTNNPRGLSPEEIAVTFLDATFEAGGGSYTPVVTRSVVISGVTGIAYELAGTYAGAPVRGRAVIAMPTGEHYLFGLGIANLVRDTQLWADQGSRLFDALVESIVFIAAEAAPTAAP